MSSKSSRQFAPSRVFVVGAIVAFSIALNTVFLGWQLRRLFKLQRHSYTFIGDDVPRELPVDLRKVNMVFHDNPDHYRLGGKPAWAEWNEILPAGKGYVYLGDSPLPYDVSMWHQLRCLNHIRMGIDVGDDGPTYTEHCAHYLRQAFLCNADLTLEIGGDRKMISNGDQIANGAGTLHTCRDWKQVYDFQEKEHEKWTPEMEMRMMEEYDKTYKHSVRDRRYPKD